MSTLSELARISARIREKGIVWTIKRIRIELQSPTFRFTEKILISLSWIKRLVDTRKDGNKLLSSNPDHMLVVYDLNINPITFDFAFFLVAAETFANSHGFQKLYVLFVKKSDANFTEVFADPTYASVVDQHNQAWRINNILIPLVNLHPSCVGYSVLPQRSAVISHLTDALVYPVGYSATMLPRMRYRDVMHMLSTHGFNGFRASRQGLRYIQEWRLHRGITQPVVVITLRQYGYETMRNSNVADWVQFASWLLERGFVPVFVPDTDTCWIPDARLEPYLLFIEPCWNLELRMALYETAYVSFFYSNGTAAIAQLNKNVCCISMNPILEESAQAKGKIYEDYGLTVGQRRYNFAEPCQFLSWKQDSFENICDEFLEFVTVRDQVTAGSDQVVR
ncbi:MAG: hypothetical protein HQL92_02450 [Magnetococcales bacterium]|nr:hypothetical protein [Magnetococcales bacterium]